MSNSSHPLPSQLIESLLKDPFKRTMILQLLNQESDNIEKYKRQELKTKTTPLKKVRKLHCESPTALQRRRALEDQKKQESTSESSSSEYSEVATEIDGPKLPFEQLLKGVIAFVEVRRDNVDRSEGIKAVMKLMGATIREKFTNDVTHVIFKDGSFTTFEKARLMKIHLVSVLWLDAIRRNNARVPERNYPAFGSRVCDQNVSILCSQIQKDYEEVIKDEKRRRHTIMAPKTSRNSYFSPKNPPREESNSPDVTSDDSDCGMIDGQVTKRSKDVDLLSSSSIITDDLSASSKRSEESASLVSHVRNKRKTINVVSNMSNVQSKKNSESVIDATPEQGSKSRKVLQNSSLQSTMSSLRMSGDTEKTRSGLGDSGKENSVHTTMSSLRLSEGSDKRKSSASDKRRSRSASKAPAKGESDSLSVDKEVEETMTKTRRTSRSSHGNTSNPELNSDWDKSGSARTASSTKSNLIANLIDTLRSNDSEGDSTASLQNESKSKSRKKTARPILESSDSETKERRKPPPPTTPRTQRASSSKSESSTKSKDPKKVRKQSPETENTRAASVTPSQNLRRSRRASMASFDEPQDKRPVSAATPKKAKKPPSSGSSPAKKQRVEAPPSNKKTRKLYNPDEITAFTPVEEDKERAEYAKQKTQKSPDEIFLNPNNVIITPFFSRKPPASQPEPSSDSGPKKATRGTKKAPPRDSSADEQRELLVMLERADQAKVRRSQRLSLSQTNPKYHFSSSSSEASSLPITPIKRRSTLDFMPLSQTQQKRKLKLDPKRTSSIVCTKMHRNEVLNFQKIVDNLGRFFVEDQVSGQTTHLVAGEAKRTVNMLKAIARGCWILKHEWLLKSAEEGRWLSEEDYELTEFSPAVQQCRLQKEAFGPLYSMDIFKDCGYVYVGKGTAPKTSDLKELISICKGKVTNLHRNAAVAVGEFHEREGLTCVTEMWVLDSVHCNKLKALKKYLIKPVGQDSPHF